MKMIHMSLNIRGALRWPDSMLEGMFKDGKGRELTAAETRNALQQELEHGREVLPLAECDGFDYSGKGCPGHPKDA